MTTDGDWIRTDLAAAMLDITPNALRVLAGRRRWPTVPLTGHWVGFHKDDILAEWDHRHAKKTPRQTPNTTDVRSKRP